MNDWKLIDDDCFQICKKVLEGMYELYQLQYAKPESEYIKAGETDRQFLVAHEFVSVQDMEKKDILDCYGFRSLEDFQEEYGDIWEGILAGYGFAIHADKRLILTKPMMYEEAKRLIIELSGCKELIGK